MSKQKTNWGIMCRVYRELVAFDPCLVWHGTAGLKPGAVRCDQGHTHICFPEIFVLILLRFRFPTRLRKGTVRSIGQLASPDGLGHGSNDMLRDG